MSPVTGAINSQPPTCAQRKERSTPTARPVSSDGSDQLPSPDGCPTGEGLVTPTAGLDRGRRTSVNSVALPALPPTESQVKSASAAFPRGQPGESESSSGHARATGIAHPGFYGRKPWSKAKQCSHYHRSRRRKRGPARPPRRIAAKSFTKVACKAFAPRPGYRHNRPKVIRRRSSRLRRALRVS